MAYFPSKRDNDGEGKLSAKHRAALPWPIRLSVALTLVLAVGLLWQNWLHNILNSSGFEPHGYCYLWIPGLVVLHVGSDALIGLSYVAISATLAYLVYRTRHDIPFQGVFIAFGIFIIACGATHFLEIWTLWHATYWLSGAVKLITAVASVATAVALPLLFPTVLTIVENAKDSEGRKQQLEQAHKELEALYARDQELDELKTQFFANVSHELRTPLTLILGPVRNLLAEKQLTGKQMNDLEVVERNAATLLKHVNDLLEIASLEVGQVQLHYGGVDLAQLLRLCAAHFEALARERSVTLALEIPASLPMQGDAEKLQRVFLNLLSNAFKFTPIGGSLRCTLYAEGERAIAGIQDNGPGIRAEMRQSIFDRFSQGESGTARRFGGSGLGLTIVKEFVELHSGSIAVSDAPGGGALFTVVLPIFAPAHIPQLDIQSPTVEAEVSEKLAYQALAELSFRPQQHGDAQIIASPETHASLVLIIEDNAEMSRFIADTLVHEYRTAAAFDGLEGLEKALTLQPDLILCDIMMPNMSGDQFVAKMRTHAELDAIPILLLSARADDSLRVQLLREGAQDYLVKPFLPDELRARAANLVAMKQARQVLQHEVSNQNQDIVVLANEVTSRKHEIQQVLEDLRESEERKDVFLSMVGHELKTPITILKVYTQLIHTMFVEEGRSQQVQQISKMERQVNKLIKLINNLLDISKTQVGNLALEEEEFEVESFIADLVDTMQQISTKHTIRLLNSTHATLFGDKDRLGEVLINLLSNAIKYSPSANVVDVIVEADEEQVTVSVRDFGVGITQKHLVKIFERFYRVYDDNDKKFPGLGVGLYLSSEIVKRHGGKIWVESVEREGSVFSFSLPLKRQSEDRVVLQGAGRHEEDTGC